MGALASTGAYIQPRAGWTLSLDGESLTDAYAPRLLSVRLCEQSGEQADELEIVLHDHDNAFTPPKQGATLTLAMGWLRGTGVMPGLVGKGSFTVDELTWSGPPDEVSIRARSANFKDSFRTRRNQVWKGTTLGAIVAAIAARHALTARCHSDLAGIAITVVEQNNKSDMQFIRDLGRRYDASATVKGGALIFAPVGSTTTATGAAMPTATIRRADCSRYSWTRASRDKAQDGASAQWHDATTGRRQTVSTGGTNPRRLKKVYASKSDATAAATSQSQRLQRASATLDLDLALGNLSLAPGMRITLTGFPAHVGSATWLIASTEHQMDDRGLFTTLKLQVA